MPYPSRKADEMDGVRFGESMWTESGQGALDQPDANQDADAANVNWPTDDYGQPRPTHLAALLHAQKGSKVLDDNPIYEERRFYLRSQPCLP